uniref:Peptidyl-prolyl cis-trans isomerase n=1 Tax=Rhizophora mucronata TaxID=61149 RepID=A0A2P2JFB1_RHIMU
MALSPSPSHLLLSKPLFLSYRTSSGNPFVPKHRLACCYHNFDDHREVQSGHLLHYDKQVQRRFLLLISVSTSLSPTLPSLGKTKNKNPYDEMRLLEQNKRIQKENNAPEDFPNFVRKGFEVKVVTSENYVKRDSGLICWDFEVGKGDCPKAGQQVFPLFSLV